MSFSSSSNLLAKKINDLTTEEAEKQKQIKRIVIIESYGLWRFLALTDTDKGPFAFFFDMTSSPLYAPAFPGELTIRRYQYHEPVPDKTDPEMYDTVKEDERILALYSVNCKAPLMTAADLIKLIVDTKMFDYRFVKVDPKGANPQIGGARHWCACLLGELEVRGRVPKGTAEDFVRFIKARSDKLKGRPKDEQIPWPIPRGIFPSTTLQYPWPEAGPSDSIKK